MVTQYLSANDEEKICIVRRFQVFTITFNITMNMKVVCIIPARFASTRFPGKPLALLGGKTVIQRVYEQVKMVIDDVYVATDNQQIFNHVEEFGGKVVMTSPNHRSGTDRIEEAVSILNGDWDVIVNVQGDEPFIHPSQIETICKSFQDKNTQIATLGFAIYFSRSVIPFVRGIEKKEWLQHYPFLKHIGLYAYRTEVLKEITQLPQSSLELAESLEQLRWIQNGYRIKVGITNIETVGIDTPEDLAKAELILKH